MVLPQIHVHHLDKMLKDVHNLEILLQDVELMALQHHINAATKDLVFNLFK